MSLIVLHGAKVCSVFKRAVNCLTNDNVINVVNPKIDSILPLVPRVESLMKQVEKLSSQMTTLQDKISKEFQNSDRIAYTQQLVLNAETSIATASTVINAQSSVVDGTIRQFPASSISEGFRTQLGKRKIEEWISHLTVNHEELQPDFDSISELRPDDSISSGGLNTSSWFHQGNGAEMLRPSPRNGKSARNTTDVGTIIYAPSRGISHERLTHVSVDEEASVSTDAYVSAEEAWNLDQISGNAQADCQADLNVRTLYDEESAKKLLSLLKTRAGKKLTLDDALLEVTRMKAGQGLESSANIVGAILNLLEKGADINVKDWQGYTALHYASKGGDTDTVNVIVSRFADINAEDECGWTALHVAAQLGHTSIVEILLNEGAEIDRKTMYDGESALKLATFNGQTSTVECLLKAGAPVDSRNKFGWTPLYSAACSGISGMVEVLLKAGAMVNAEDNERYTPLHVAADKGHVEIVKMLLKGGASINAGNKDADTPPLHLAAYRGDIELVKMLLKAGASVQAKDNSGCTSLHDAALSGHIVIVKMLLKAGASVQAKDNSGCTSLHDAVSRDKIEICRILLRAGAPVDAKTARGETPLMFAAFCGHRKSIELLLAAGAHIDAKSKDGWTALSYVFVKHVDCDKGGCAFCDNSETRAHIAKLLCERGADPSAKSHLGTTVISLIDSKDRYTESERRELIELLGSFQSRKQNQYPRRPSKTKRSLRQIHSSKS